MKKLMIALIAIVMSGTSFATSSECYEKLLRGRIDSVVHQMYVIDIAPQNTLMSMSITALINLLKNSGCSTNLKKIQCGQAIKGNNLTNICYAESDWGYFLVNKDYLDNLNIIFNRWD